MPSGPGVVSDELIADIAQYVGSKARTFLLTSRVRAADVIAQHSTVGTSTLQLVDAMEPGSYEALRDALPGVELVQVIHVTGPESVDEAVAIATQVDAILLDSGNPAAAVKQLGGTGRVHDWSLSARIREAIDIPLFLAGGLRVGNVAEAIERVEPFGLDLCSGVRTDGRLDDGKLRAFMRTVARSIPTNQTTRLVAAFLDRTLPKALWTHEAHLRVGLWHVRRFGPRDALDRLRTSIRAYNVSVGGENSDTAGYHETITRFYVIRISDFLSHAKQSATDDVLADELLQREHDRELPLRFWSRARLFSRDARREWVAPDLAPLPAVEA
jgi:phosphoribosylanthranilate isomerase